jgi:hypothetical protein
MEVDGDHRPQDRVGTQKDQTCNQKLAPKKNQGRRHAELKQNQNEQCRELNSLRRR